MMRYFLILLLFPFSLFAALPNAAVNEPVIGFREIPFFDESQKVDRQLLVWYPVSAETPGKSSSNSWDLFRVAQDAPIDNSKGKFPLIVLSHGYTGNPHQLSWLIQGLVNQGFIVIAVQHRDLIDGKVHINHWQRAQDVHELIDQFSASDLAKQADLNHIGITGFSLGGTTAVWSIGGRSTKLDTLMPKPEYASPGDFIKVNEALPTLNKEMMAKDWRDPRIKAAFMMAPAWAWLFDEESLQKVKVPTYVTAGEGDRVLVSKNNAGFFARHIPNAIYEPISGKADHFIFVSALNEQQRQKVNQSGNLNYLFQDDPSVDRAKIQSEVTEKAVQFFKKVFNQDEKAMQTQEMEPSLVQFVFKNSQYSFQALRAVAAMQAQAADVGECLVTARAIKEGDDESWYREWSKLAKRTEDQAIAYKENQHNESARTAFLRASNYYRTAEFFLHTNQDDPRSLATWQKSRDCFLEAAKLSPHPIRQVQIPFESGSLPGYFCLASNDGAPRPLVIIQTGFDGTAEELYYQIGYAAVARGYNCLLFEGPGQGAVIREQHLPFRPNWETVVTPVLDFALQQKEVDKGRVALVGISFGGYLVPRALAFEHRFKAAVVNGGVYDFHKVCMRNGMKEEYLDNPEIAQEVNKVILNTMKTDPAVRWAVGNGMFTFGAKTPTEWLKMTRAYQLKNVIGQIKTPMLVMDSDRDEDMPGQSKEFFEALSAPKEYILFTSAEGAGEHCQVGASAISNERLFNWLDNHL